ncbi:MAG TPA: HAMP domain-containing sensor histidine kinase, partial [Desulfomonilia bacterium]|nr:HAMP domain-containing sensor histidine kinase [Desulfomonilia bacterium]
AREDSERLHEIIENLLDISRIESGKMEMDIKPVSPGELVLNAAESFRIAARDKGVDLFSDLPEDLPNVLADTTQIAHVFANLVSNALKYTPPPGKITISARADNEEVRFGVSDTGKGIPSQYLNRVFNRFFRVPGQETETGTGLGLSIAREIVEAHGGVISADSSEGNGATFSFTLPRADRMMVLTSENEEQTWLM